MMTAQDIIFLSKQAQLITEIFILAKAPVIIENFHNYLAFFLVSRYNFLDHINEKILKGY